MLTSTYRAVISSTPSRILGTKSKLKTVTVSFKGTRRGLAMGTFFGKVDVEMPTYEVLKHFAEDGYKYNIRRYPSSVAVEVNSNSLGISGSDSWATDSAFRVLASYIGVFTTPQNRSRESVAMTAPVVTSNKGELVAMTAPVITTNEKVAMTAPVITSSPSQPDSTEQGAGQGEHVSMTAPVVTSGKDDYQSMCFLLPSKYTMDTAPEPLDPRVKLREVPPRDEAVYQYSGRSNMTNCQPEVDQLLAHLRRDGVKVVDGGKWHLARYNPPYCLPFLRTNEIHVPVEYDSEI